LERCGINAVLRSKRGALEGSETYMTNTGYDAVALACPERFVIGLDISDMAGKKAKQVC